MPPSLDVLGAPEVTAGLGFALILLAYRHALRVAELVALRWDQIDLAQGLLHVTRAKNGTPSTHPLRGPEIRALRRLQRDYAGPYVFVTERKGPLTTSAVRKIIARAGEFAALGFPVHPHMLRHACGFKLANDGHDTRAIQHYLAIVRTDSRGQSNPPRNSDNSA